jgi:protein-S-isoprenylcysteine O-methyltransferase Ste14
MSLLRYCVIAAGTVLWCAPFVIGFRRTKGSPFLSDTKARWGVALECIGYSLLWQGAFWQMEPAGWRLALSAILFGAACLLSWPSTRALEGHLRVEAGLDADHRLVRTGPYRVVRHPIYTSMLCVLIATGILVAPPLLFFFAVLFFLVGNEIRMRVEDGLLRARFGEQFVDYERAVPRLIPFL